MIASTGSWLPIGGMTSIDHPEMSLLGKTWDLARHLVVPALVIATAITASLTRIMRANMLEVLGQQYTTTARAKGLTERVVLLKHALRNAVNPMITILGFNIGEILSGAALVEIVTGWPGLGKLILTATAQPGLLPGGGQRGVRGGAAHDRQPAGRHPAGDHRSQDPDDMSTRDGSAAPRAGRSAAREPTGGRRRGSARRRPALPRRARR